MRDGNTSNTMSLAQALGYAGLLPFVAAASAVWLLPTDGAVVAAAALSAYAAVIVSFLGGIHWGIGFRDGEAASFVWGVVPSLLAWVAVMLPHLSWSLGASGLCLLLCWGVDRVRYPAAGLSTWLPLRHVLTAVAALSCFAGAAGV